MLAHSFVVFGQVVTKRTLCLAASSIYGVIIAVGPTLLGEVGLEPSCAASGQIGECPFGWTFADGACFQVFGDAGSMVHVCEATAAQLASADAGTHPIFCGMRAMMHAIGVGTPDPSDPLTSMGIGSPAAASQFIVPVIFVLMGVRLIFNGTLSFISLKTGKDYGDEGGEEALAKKAAAQENKPEGS